MSTTPSFPKDTSPNAINRARQVSNMSLEQAKAALLKSHAHLNSLSLSVWWKDLLQQRGVALTESIINDQHGPITKSVNVAVALYDTTFDRLLIDHAISAARKKGGWRMAENVKSVLLALFFRMEQKSPRPLPEIPPRVLAVIPLEVARRINRMAYFTPINVSQFSAVPPPRLKTQFENAVWACDLDPIRFEACGRAKNFAQVLGTCELHKLDAVRQQVEIGKGAVCTSFAATTASILMSGNKDNAYRVEMISGPNHCFCLVNRAMSDKDDVESSGATLMPGAKFWGDEVILIDAWAGALGHAVFYSSPKDFPQVLQAYLTMKLRGHYDSSKKSNAKIDLY